MAEGADGRYGSGEEVPALVGKVTLRHSEIDGSEFIRFQSDAVPENPPKVLVQMLCISSFKRKVVPAQSI